jgi:hypothetical protein
MTDRLDGSLSSLDNEIVVQELEVAEQNEEVVEQVEEEVLMVAPGYVPDAGSSTSSSEAEESPRFREQLAILFLLNLLSQSIVAGTDITTIDEWQNILCGCILHYRYPDGVPVGNAE